MRSILLALATALLLSACGGGGGSEGPPPIPAGVYQETSDNASFTVLVDGEGRLVGHFAENLPHATSNFAGFSGVMIIEGNNWHINNAKLDIETFTLGTTPPTVTATTTVTIPGSYVMDASLSFQVPSPVMPLRFATPVTLSFRNLAPIAGASLAQIAGRWINVSTGADMTISSTGQVSGRAGESCLVGGSVRVTQPSRNVYTAMFTFEGEDCPGPRGASTTVLGYIFERSNASLGLFFAGALDGAPFTVELTKSPS